MVAGGGMGVAIINFEDTLSPQVPSHFLCCLFSPRSLLPGLLLNSLSLPGSEVCLLLATLGGV